MKKKTPWPRHDVLPHDENVYSKWRKEKKKKIQKTKHKKKKENCHIFSYMLYI